MEEKVLTNSNSGTEADYITIKINELQEIFSQNNVGIFFYKFKFEEDTYQDNSNLLFQLNYSKFKYL